MDGVVIHSFTVILIGLPVLLATEQYLYGPDNGPHNWPSLFHDECAEGHQSPINIVTNEVIPIHFEPFYYYHFEDHPQNVTIHDTGNTVKVEFQFPPTSGPIVSGGGLLGIFKVLQLHFHWGDESSEGSEHTVNDQRFPLEMHLVTINLKYSNMTEALDKHDGVAVFAFLYKSARNPRMSEGFEKLFSVVNKTLSGQEFAHLSSQDAFSIQDLFFNLSHTMNSGFYRYSGSLTTPSCNENVTWTIFKVLQDVSETELETFRGIFSFRNQPTKSNFRPTQPLNGRIVLESKPLHPLIDLSHLTQMKIDKWQKPKDFVKTRDKLNSVGFMSKGANKHSR